MTSPTRSKVVTGHKAKGPKSGGMISTFITQVNSVAVQVLHGEPVLGLQRRPLTCKCQLNMCAGLNRAQAHTSSMFGVKKNTRI